LRDAEHRHGTPGSVDELTERDHERRTEATMRGHFATPLRSALTNDDFIEPVAAVVALWAWLAPAWSPACHPLRRSGHRPSCHSGPALLNPSSAKSKCGH